jgi:hypothetical protein
MEPQTKNEEIKPLIWGELKKFANELPDEFLKEKVRVWREDDGYLICSAFTLEEDYVDDGEGLSPISITRECAELGPGEIFEEEYPVILVKGTPILEEDFGQYKEQNRS